MQKIRVQSDSGFCVAEKAADKHFLRRFLVDPLNRQKFALVRIGIFHPSAAGKENVFNGNILTVLNKKLIANSLNILFDMLNRAGSNALVTEASDYLMIAVYRMFRIVYSANPKNQSALFKLPATVAHQYSLAAMEVHCANTLSIAEGKPVAEMDPIKDTEKLTMSTESISKDYPLFASSLLNLVSNAEKAIDFSKK